MAVCIDQHFYYQNNAAIGPKIKNNNFFKNGSKFRTINASIKKLTKLHIILTFFSFLIKTLRPVKNILPPSTGPSGSKLNNAIPTLINHNQKNNSFNQKNVQGITLPYLVLISSFITAVFPDTLIPRYPCSLFNGFYASLILNS